MMKFNGRKDAQRILMVIIASIFYAFNMNTFVDAAGLFPGGFAGLSLLLKEAAQRFLGLEIPYSVFNLTLNAIPAILAFRFIGKKFTILSCVSIILMSFFTDILPGFNVTSEPLLLSVFGGMINGAMISVYLLAGATSGGTDFISIFLSERYNRDSFGLILGCNVVMLSTAGLLFGWERAMYSIIFQFASTQVINLLYKRYQQQTLLIVTEQPDAVYTAIKDTTNHGATLFKGTGLYEHQERSMVYSVVSSDEIRTVVTHVREADPKAFINAIKTDSLTGHFYRRPND